MALRLNPANSLLVALLVGALLGLAALLLSPLIVIGVLAVVIAVPVTVRRPEIALLGILAATSSVIYENSLPLLPIGVGSLHVTDIVLLGSFGLIFVRALAEPKFSLVRTPLDLPVLGFFALAALSTIVGVYQGSVAFVPAFRELRVVTYYLTFFMVTNLVRDRVQVRFFIDGLLMLAALVAAVMIAQFALGDSIRLLPGRVETLETQGASYEGITRVLPPGQSLMLVGFITLAAMLALNEHRAGRPVRFLQWGLLALGLAITFNRSYWAGAGLALLLIVWLGRQRDRLRVVALAVAGTFVLSVIVLVITLGPEQRASRLLEASWDRLSTLGNGDILEDQSLQGRYVEYEFALPQVTSNLVLGLGMGANYRPFVDGVDWAMFDGRGYIHNGHLWIMLKAGFASYLLLACMSILFLYRGFKYWRRLDTGQARAATLGFTLAYLAVLIACITSPMLVEWFWTPVIGMMAGLNEVSIHLASGLSDTRS